MMESVISYGTEVSSLEAEEKRSVNAVEMAYLRRSAGKSRLERIWNEEISRIMDPDQAIVQWIEMKNLKCFGHML